MNPEVTVTVELFLDDEAAGEPSASSSVQHLPPVVLHVVMVAGYPSSCPPECTLVAPWLTRSRAAELLQCLRDVWEEQGPGIPVVFALVDRIRLALSESLARGSGVLRVSPASAMDSTTGQAARYSDGDEGPSDGGGQEDGEQLAQDLFLGLVSFDRARRQEVFDRTTQTCSICLEVRLPRLRLPLSGLRLRSWGRHPVQDKLGAHFHRLTCGCLFCKACLQGQCTIHVTEARRRSPPSQLLLAG